MSRTLNVVVFGDVDLNLLDGSAIWAQSMVETVSGVSDTDVSLVLKAPIQTDRLIAPLVPIPNVTIVKPFEEALLPNLSRSLSPHQVVQIFEQLDQRRHVDLFIVRGLRVVRRLIEEETLHGRLWVYLTDIPQSMLDVTDESRAELARIADAAGRILCQTEDLRSHFEQVAPEAVGKTILTPPVVSVPADLSPEPRRSDGPLRLVYTGKMAIDWRTEGMTELPTALARVDVDAEVHVVGDKIHNEPSDPEFATRMRASLGREGVTWHGGVSRQRAMEIASSCDIGLCWRSQALDASLELSTKLLEFGALGVPAILNRTSAHERLLGERYPLFIESDDDVVPVLARAADPDLRSDAAEVCRRAAEEFSIDRARERFERAFATVRPIPPASVGSERRRVLVASHDLKFMTRLLDELSRFDAFDIRVDAWPALAEHDEAQSRELLEWADVVVCEWCGPNAIWYSKHVRADQRLIVRLHRFELYARYPGEVRADALDTVVTVDDHYRSLVRERLPQWDAERVISVPNWVDIAALRREKLGGANFHLGMIGIAPRRKRLDVALDVLAKLRADDPRFTLFIKTKMPWDYWWIWNDSEEQKHYRAAMRRIQTDPLLEGGVVFDPFGPDVGNWLRKIGAVLSTSDDESFHLSPAEGMASGAVPVVFPWPGADTVYDPRWIVQSADDAAARLAEFADVDVWRADAAVAQEQIEQYDLPRVTGLWAELLAR